MKSRAVRGFTYLALLWWVAISGLMLAALGQSWAIESRRQREIELVFRGEQIREALLAYQANSPSDVKVLPEHLEDLLMDARGPKVKHHLRRLWPDPITGGSWGLVLDGGVILGVYSSGLQSPLRAPMGITSYAQWQFVVQAVGAQTPVSVPSVVKTGSVVDLR